MSRKKHQVSGTAAGTKPTTGRIKPRVFVDQDVLTLARERVALAFDRFDRVAVSFSGGKDSTVVLHLALEQAEARNQPLDVFFWDEEAIQPQTVDYVALVRSWPLVRMRWLCWPVEHRNACSRRSPYWWPWAPEDRALWVREPPEWADLSPPAPLLPQAARLPYKDLNGYLFPRERGEMVGILTGIRAQESLRRRSSVSMRVGDNWYSADPNARWVNLCKPIYDWQTEDVWTAPHLLGWPYNHAYDVMQAAGFSRALQRICQPFGEEPLEQFHLWATCWPELWARMINRVPGARTAARYNQTNMYGYGKRSVPTDGDWQGAIDRELAHWREAEADQIRANIQEMLRLHASKTTDPVPETEAHHISGVSWAYLLAAAQRGDLKGRRAGKLASLALETCEKRARERK